MKMKKLISLFAAMTMAVSAFTALTSTASAVSVSDPIQASINVEEVTDFSGSMATYDGRAYGYTTYLVTVSVTNLPLSSTYVPFGGLFSGTSITGSAVKIKSTEYPYSDMSQVMEGKDYYTVVPATLSVWDNAHEQLTYTAAVAPPVPAYPKGESKTIAATDDVVVYQYVYAIKPEVSFDLTLDYVELCVTEFENNGVKTAEVKYTTDNGNIALPTNKTVTVGTPAGPTFTDDTQKGSAATSFATNADRTYNVGVKADAIVVPAGSTATKIKFGFSTDDATALRTTASYEVVLPTAVQSGAVSVALNVTSVPEGVTLTYTGATVE